MSLPNGISVGYMVKDPPMDRLPEKIDFLAPYVSEFVIVDTGSDPVIVKAMRDFPKTRVFEETFEDFSITRNKGIERHEYEWTLILDPDELPSKAMLDLIVHVTSPEAMEQLHKGTLAWTFFTRNWWGGWLGSEEPYHWHIRLFQTEFGRFYRPVHELVMLKGQTENQTRHTRLCKDAPKDCYLIHSKGAMEIEKADALYASMGEVSR